MNNSKINIKDKVSKDFCFAILKKNFEDFGDNEVINEFGQTIVKIKTNFFNQNKVLEFLGMKYKKFILSKKNKRFIPKKYDLKDRLGNIVAFIRKKGIYIKSSTIDFNINKNNKRYSAVGDFRNWSYIIIDTLNDKTIARVKCFKGEISIPNNSYNNKNNFYLLELISKSIEKFIVISFVIAINDLIYYPKKASDISGFERRVARLRPFGPGKSLN
ncbi:MAG: hypothetical protein ACFE92_17965 [Promethearchaeota archaeon]